MRTCCTEASLKNLKQIDYICITEHSLKRKTRSRTMDRQAIEDRCYGKAKELLTKYFGDFATISGVVKPETLENIYTDELPRKIAEEFRAFLAGLWSEIAPEGAKSFDEIMNRKRSIDLIHDDYDDFLPSARLSAETITLWEKITKTNHKDVTYYKGLLKQYTEELLETMAEDFLEDVV